MTTYHFNIREVAQAALKAYREKRLTAQHRGEQSALQGCTYDDGAGHCCALGAAFPPDLLGKLRAVNRLHTTVGVLNAYGYLSFDNLTAARLLQEAHDQWARSGKPYYRQLFLQRAKRFAEAA